ncbi:hypothetical protein SALBM217S_00411 [Streptomyces griseoloalbus]
MRDVVRPRSCGTREPGVAPNAPPPVPLYRVSRPLWPTASGRARRPPSPSPSWWARVTTAAVPCWRPVEHMGAGGGGAGLLGASRLGKGLGQLLGKGVGRGHGPGFGSGGGGRLGEELGEEFPDADLTAFRGAHPQMPGGRCGDLLDRLGGLQLDQRVPLVEVRAVVGEPPDDQVGGVVVVEFGHGDRHPGRRLGAVRGRGFGLTCLRSEGLRRGGRRAGRQGPGRAGLDLVGDPLRAEQHPRLQVRRGRHHGVGRVQQQYGCPQSLPDPRVHPGGDLGAPGTALGALLRHGDQAGVRQQRQHRLQVGRVEPGRDQDVRGDPPGAQEPRRVEGPVRGAAGTDQHHVGGGAVPGGHVRPAGGSAAQRVPVVLVHHPVAEHPPGVEDLVLEEHRGPPVEALGELRVRVVEGTRLVQRQVGHAEEVLLEALAVGGAVATVAADGAAHHDRHRHPVAVHGHRLGDQVEYLVEGERGEVAEHHLHDRLVARERQTARHAGNARLADRGGEHPVRVAGRQAAGHLEGAAVRVADVLAEQMQ